MHVDQAFNPYPTTTVPTGGTEGLLHARIIRAAGGVW